MKQLEIKTSFDIWYNFPALRSTLKKMKVLGQNGEGTVFLPCIDCIVENTTAMKEKPVYRKNFPFWHQKFEVMLNANEGNWKHTMEIWQDSTSFVCGPNMEKTVFISNK